MEAYIRDVKDAAHQLNYNDDAVLHLIKAIMPSEIYGTLYNQNDLPKAFYMRHPHLHKYLKFNSTIRDLQVGNGELIATLCHTLCFQGRRAFV